MVVTGFTAAVGSICCNGEPIGRMDGSMNETFFSRVVENMAEGVAVADRDGGLIYVNAALCRYSGYSQEEIIGQASVDFIAPRQQADFRHQLALRGRGVAYPYETTIVCRDGSKLPVLVSPHPLFDERDEFAGSFAVVSDISARRRTETEREVISSIIRGIVETDNLDELLSLVHESLRRVIYAENCFVALLDEANDTIQFPYFVDEYASTQEPIRQGKTCTDYVLRTGRPLVLTETRFQELLESGEVELVGPSSPSWMGVPLTTPTRTIGVLAVQHYKDEGAYSDEDLEFFGSVGGHIALAIERKRAEEQLHASQELYTNVVESMSDGVMVLDREFHFLYWNRAMEELTGVRRSEVLGHAELPWEIFPHLEDLGVDRMMQRAMTGERQIATNLVHEFGNGLQRSTNEIYRPLRDAEGEIQGVVGVVRDVTERRRAQAALEEREEQLRQAQKMEAIGRLAGGIAHDFNNLLTAINGYSELILERLAGQDPIRAPVEEIKAAGEHAADLTQQLLAFSRKQVIRPRVVDLNRLIVDLQSMLTRIIGEDIELVTQFDDALDHVKTDPGNLEDVLAHLVVNARDAMPQGGRLTIRTENRFLAADGTNGDSAAGPHVGLVVADTGVGMEPEVEARVFEPFFTTKEMGKGTGMGLSTVYGIVKQNRGRVWVETEPERGSTFLVFFPRSLEPLTRAEVGRPRAGELAGSETVLVVEDEAAVRSLTQMILERNGYRVLAAGSAAEALQLHGELDGPIDLLLSDVVMPETSGPQLAAKLQSLQPDLKVLFFSGHADETIVRHGVLLPDTELLVKPFSVNQLLTRVRRILHDWQPESQVG